MHLILAKLDTVGHEKKNEQHKKRPLYKYTSERAVQTKLTFVKQRYPLIQQINQEIKPS